MSKQTQCRTVFLRFENALFQEEILDTREEFQGRLSTFIEDEGGRLVHFGFTVSGDNGPLSSKTADQTMYFKPYNLTLALDDTGKALLNLKDYFIPMSLYTKLSGGANRHSSYTKS